MKQYRYSDATFGKHNLYVYNDGVLAGIKPCYTNELNYEIDRLEAMGYTYGYTKDEIEEARNTYERMLENAIH